MTKYPFHELKVTSDGKSLLAAAQSSLQKFDLTTGELVASYAVVDKTAEEDLENPPRKKAKADDGENSQNGSAPEKKEVMSSISGEGAKAARYLILSRNEKYVIAFTNDNKSVVVLDALDLKEVSKRKFPKRPSTLSTTFDDERLIVGDKFGDVYDVALTSTEPVTKPSDGKTEDQASIEPILGHVSMLTDVEVVQKTGETGKTSTYILTCDRDEHIRVSRYPQSFVVERWLFGHEEFVSTLAVPNWLPEYVVSGGGDNFVAVFKWGLDKDALVDKFDVRQYVEKYLSTEFHAAPKRKKDPESKANGPLEVTVNKIIPIAKYKQILVQFEATNALLVLSLGDDGKLSHLSTFERPDSRIVAVTASDDGKIAISLDPAGEKEVPLLELYETSESGTLTKIESPEAQKIAEAGSFPVEEAGEKVTLYTIKHLRKRGEH